MKQFLLSTLAFLFIVAGQAQETQERKTQTNSNYNNAFANLTISTTGTSNLRVAINGKRMNQQERSVTYEGMMPGTYQIIIYQRQNNRQGSAYVEVYRSNVALKAQRHYEISVLRFGKISFDEGYIEYEDDWNTTNTGSWNNNDNNNNGYGYQQAVNDNDFNSIKSTISKAYSDSDKLLAMKAVMKNNWFTTSQIKTLVNLLFTNSNRLAAAKFAYDYCVDKNNYHTLVDLFSSSSNRSEFMTFLASK